jgi:hypothetical protein
MKGVQKLKCVFNRIYVFSSCFFTTEPPLSPSSLNLQLARQEVQQAMQIFNENAYNNSNSSSSSSEEDEGTTLSRPIPRATRKS